MNFSEILTVFQQAKPKAKSHIKNLIDMAIADGELSQEELTLLRDIAKKHHISEGQLKDLRNNAGKVNFEVPEDEREKFQQLYDLVHMMIADKKIHHEEMKLCDFLATKFGYSQKKIKDIIETVRLNIENGNGYDETMKRISMLLV